MPSSPYGPDRSLPAAVLVLVAGMVVCGGAIYLLYGLTDGGMQGHASRIASSAMESRAWQPRRAPTPSQSGFSQRRMASPDPSGSRVPSWLGGSGTRMSSPASGRYDMNADMGHARIGPVAPEGGARSSALGAGDVPSRGESPPPVADLGTSPSFSSGESGQALRSEVSRLNGRLRALSGALGQFDQSRSGDSEATSSQSRRGTATTSSGAQTSDREVPPPPNVPIDDHLHWLLVAGLLWGVWRVSRG